MRIFKTIIYTLGKCLRIYVFLYKEVWPSKVPLMHWCRAELSMHYKDRPWYGRSIDAQALITASVYHSFITLSADSSTTTAAPVLHVCLARQDPKAPVNRQPIQITPCLNRAVFVCPCKLRLCYFTTLCQERRKNACTDIYDICSEQKSALLLNGSKWLGPACLCVSMHVLVPLCLEVFHAICAHVIHSWRLGIYSACTVMAPCTRTTLYVADSISIFLCLMLIG